MDLEKNAGRRQERQAPCEGGAIVHRVAGRGQLRRGCRASDARRQGAERHRDDHRECRASNHQCDKERGFFRQPDDSKRIDGAEFANAPSGKADRQRRGEHDHRGCRRDLAAADVGGKGAGNRDVGRHRRKLDRDAQHQEPANSPDCLRAVGAAQDARDILAPHEDGACREGQQKTRGESDEFGAACLDIERDPSEQMPRPGGRQHERHRQGRQPFVSGHDQRARQRHAASRQKRAARDRLADNLKEQASGNLAEAQRGDGVADAHRIAKIARDQPQPQRRQHCAESERGRCQGEGGEIQTLRCTCQRGKIDLAEDNQQRDHRYGGGAEVFEGDQARFHCRGAGRRRHGLCGYDPAWVLRSTEAGGAIIKL